MEVKNPKPSEKRRIASGNYAGDNGDNRQITTGFKCAFVIVWEAGPNTAIMITDASFEIEDTTAHSAGSALHATDGFVVSTATDVLNATGRTYYYFALEAD